METITTTLKSLASRESAGNSVWIVPRATMAAMLPKQHPGLPSAILFTPSRK